MPEGGLKLFALGYITTPTKLITERPSLCLVQRMIGKAAFAATMDIAAFADGHLKGYSVTAEIFDHMAAVKEITYAAWEQIFTLGQAPVSMMEDVCRQIHQMSQETGARPPASSAQVG